MSAELYVTRQIPECTAGTKRKRHKPQDEDGGELPGTRTTHEAGSPMVRTVCALYDLCAQKTYDARGPRESREVVFEGGALVNDVGNVRSLEIYRPSDLRAEATLQRVKCDGLVVFRLMPTIMAVSDIDLIATIQVLVAHIEFRSSNLPTSALEYSVEVAPAIYAAKGCIDVAVSVPAGASEGSEVVLRSVSVAGFDVELGTVPVRAIVGFNHEPAPAGRFFAAAERGDIPAMMHALGDGCSTQEADAFGGVSVCVRCDCITRSHFQGFPNFLHTLSCPFGASAAP